MHIFVANLLFIMCYLKTGLFMFIHLKNRFVRLTSLKTIENSMTTLVYLVSVLVNSWSKKRKENYGTPV